MHETHGCSPARKTWGAIRVYGPSKFRTLLRCCCHMRSPGSLWCVLAILAQYSMNSYVYSTGFERCPFGCSAGPCRRRTGFGTASLAEQYGSNTWPIEPTSMGALRITHDYLRAQNRRKPISESYTCSSFNHGLHGPVRVQKPMKKRTNPQRGHPPSLIRVFALRLIGKEGHKASSYEQRSLIKRTCHFG